VLKVSYFLAALALVVRGFIGLSQQMISCTSTTLPISSTVTARPQVSQIRDWPALILFLGAAALLVTAVSAAAFVLAAGLAGDFLAAVVLEGAFLVTAFCAIVVLLKNS
jgi:hypothetical protein